MRLAPMSISCMRAKFVADASARWCRARRARCGDAPRILARVNRPPSPSTTLLPQHPRQPGRAPAPGAGSAARRRQDHAGAAGAARRAVAGGPQDRDAGAAPRRRARRRAASWRAQRGEAVGDTVGYRIRFENKVSARHADRGRHRRHPHPHAAGRPDAGRRRRAAVRRIPRTPSRRRPRPRAGARRAGAACARTCASW